MTTIPAQAITITKTIPLKSVTDDPCGGHDVTIKHGSYGSYVKVNMDCSGASITRIYLYYCFWSDYHDILYPTTIKVKLYVGDYSTYRVYTVSGHAGFLDKSSVLSLSGRGAVKVEITTKAYHHKVLEFHPPGGWTTSVTSTFTVGYAGVC